MLPEDPIEILSERNAAEGASSLPTNHNTDDDSNHAITTNLLVLLHMQKCQERKREAILNGQASYKCPSSICESLGRFCHLINCKDAECFVDYCKASRVLFEHWKDCEDQECFLCTPVMQFILQQFSNFIAERGTQLQHAEFIERMKANLVNLKKSIWK